MKFIIVVVSLFIGLNSLAKENRTNQIYELPIVKPEIPWDQIDSSKNVDLFKKKKQRYYIALVRGDLHYHLDSLNSAHESQHYRPHFLGLSFGQKTENQFLNGIGNLEIGGEWQKFKSSKNSNSQNFQIFQIHLLQNRDLWNWRKLLFLSAGIGMAPVYLVAEQSIMRNSVSHFGALVLGQMNISYPLKSGFDIYLGLKSGYGKVGGSEIIISSVHIGMNFE